MKQNLEIELKTLVTKSQFEQLIQFYAPAHFVQQTNHYFQSSPKSTTQSIRVREINQSYLFTYKKKTENGVIEYEKVIPSLAFDQDPEIMTFLNNCQLFPPYNEVGSLTTERHLVNINNQAELCFDINHYNGITDYEIEYEVTAPHDHHSSFQEILNQANIEFIPNPTSKVKRCLSTIHN